MMPPIRPVRLLLFLACVAVFAATLALWGCGGDQGTTEPLTDIAVRKGAALHGTVVDVDGAPAADAVIALERLVDGIPEGLAARLRTSRAPDLAALEKAAGVRTASSDDNGHFGFGELEAGAYLLTTSLRSHQGDTRTFLVTPEAAAKAETTFVDIQLTPTGTFLGTVTRENTADHGGTLVYVDGTSYVAVSGPDGSYFLAGVPVGTWHVTARYPGFLPVGTDGTLTAAGDSVALDPLLLRLDSNIPPVASITTFGDGFVGVPVAFDGTGLDEDGSIVLYEWDFQDDGVFDYASADSAASTFTYAAPGQYRVKLRVTDDRGGRGLAARSLSIVQNIFPVADATAPMSAIVAQSAAFAGTGTDADGSIVLFEWDFDGDGAFDWSGTSAAATHTFMQAGWYTARLRVTDDRGATGEDTISFEAVLDGVFVSTTGSDANAGTPAAPVLKISKGTFLAVQRGLSRVYATKGTYESDYIMDNGISILGGRDPVTWQELPGQYTTLKSVSATSRADNITAATVIRGVEFLSWGLPTGDGKPSIGLSISNSSSQLVFESCRFTSTAGREGLDNFSSSPGSPGGPGQPGGAGACDSDPPGQGGAGGSSPAACPGGAGGRGGYAGSNSGLSGTAGGCGGGAAGAGGLGGSPGQDGFNGSQGAAGTQGWGGTSASGHGTIVSGQWQALVGTQGQAGGNGKGGGGGGGGGGQYMIFTSGAGNGGGGGGGGGTGGQGGYGGGGGGASFAVFLYNASPVFQNCIFQAGSGGNGGMGGDSGVGGAGGAGGQGGAWCSSEIGRGGNGGPGGSGGSGGPGAGGPGGPSYCVAMAGTCNPTLGGTFVTGSGGSGGMGGLRGGTSTREVTGEAGPSGTTRQY